MNRYVYLRVNVSGQKNMRCCSTPLVIREVQAKTTGQAVSLPPGWQKLVNLRKPSVTGDVVNGNSCLPSTGMGT